VRGTECVTNLGVAYNADGSSTSSHTPVEACSDFGLSRPHVSSTMNLVPPAIGCTEMVTVAHVDVRDVPLP